MGSTTYPSACDIGGSDYVYRSQDQLPLPTHYPVNNTHPQPYTVTPPESLASGVRDFGHEDVGRLSDVLEEESERFHNNNGADVIDVKDVVLLEDTPVHPPPEATTNSVPMVNVCSNKISLCNGTDTSKGSFAAQMYLKEAMKDIFVNISNAFNTPELIVLEGANGAVAVHKSVISAYSALVKDQLTEYPDCTTIYLPNYSQKIIRKVVEILYTGETFYSEQEKKDVNLIWDAMRQLQVSFSDKSFYYHPVEYTAVKEEGEEEQNSQQQQQVVASTQDQLEVDHTDEIWHDDQSSNSKANSAYSYCRVIRQPHPENPAKSLYVHSQYGEGRKIQRGMPALSHVNEKEIREKQKEENQRQVEMLLSRHKPIVIDLLDDDEDKERSSPKKRIRTTQTYAAGTTVLRDEGFKNLVASGKMTLDMVKAATVAVKQHQQHGDRNGQTGNNQTEANQLVINHTLQDGISCVAPNETLLLLDSNRVPSVVIPPNRPEGTGITFMQKSPTIAKESAPSVNLTTALSSAQPGSEMPILRPVPAAMPIEPSQRKLRERKKSGDIIDIPRLDRIDDPFQEKTTTTRDNETDNTNSDKSIDGDSAMLTAVVIPGSKVNQFMHNQQRKEHDPSSSGNSCVAPCDIETDSRPGVEQRRMRKRKQEPSMCSVENGKELQRLREIYQQQQQQKRNVIVLGSTKMPVPDNVIVDAYVENMDEDDLIDNDYRCYFNELNWVGNKVDPLAPPAFPLNGPSASKSLPYKTVERTAVPTTRGRTLRNGDSERGGRGGRPRLQAAEKPKDDEASSEDNCLSTRGPTKRRGGRRGAIRGGYNS